MGTRQASANDREVKRATLERRLLDPRGTSVLRASPDEGDHVETLTGTLLERVDKLIEAQKSQQLLSTTATPVAIAELAARSDGLEQALREIAVEVQRLAAAREG